MKQADQIRESVAAAYAQAVKPGATARCCGTTATGCCGGPMNEPTGLGVQNYRPEELASLPRDAAAHSFGCGNPLAFGEVREGEVVLDLGSGAGTDLILAGRRVGPAGRVIGIDMTEEMIAKARMNIVASGLDHIEVRRGIIEDLPVESGTVDWVISNCVVNLSPEKDRVFAEIARVLKPGGRMRISDIVVEDLPDWLRESETLHHSCIGGAIGEKEYLDGLKAAGLADVDVADRFVYDFSQLAALARAEFLNKETLASCCEESNPFDPMYRAAEELEGKVWSVVFTARKPEPS